MENLTPGLCGLINLGYTGYMNSALQCLSNVPQLTEYFLDDLYKQHINRDNPLGMKGDIAKVYGELIHEMWSVENKICSPASLRRNVARYAPQFHANAPNDAQEFMSFLLDGLHEDLNLVKQRPYVEKKDDDGKSDDATLAAQQWEYYRKRNQSKIHDIFHGQIKSVRQCLTCGTKIRTFDPICFLNLPLPPKTKIQTFKIDYVRLNGQIKSYSIKSNKYGRMQNLIQAFCDRFQSHKNKTDEKEFLDTDCASISEETNHDKDKEDESEEEEDFTKASDYDGHQPQSDYILPVQVYNHQIDLQYENNFLLTNILERTQIVFYQVPYSLTKVNNETILIPCVFRDNDEHKHFGYPIYLSVPRQKCQGKHIEEALQKTIGQFLPLLSTDSSDQLLYTAFSTLNYYNNQQTVILKSLLNTDIDFHRKNMSLIIEVSSSIVNQYKKQQDEKCASNSSVDYRIQRHNEEERSTTLLDCFKYFTAKEKLTEHGQMYCPKCQTLKNGTRKHDIWLLPKILIVQIRRYNYTHYSRNKIDLFVDCPLHDLDLSRFVLNPAEKAKAKYDLIAVSNHMGGLEGDGYYTTHAKNIKDQKWYEFADTTVKNIDEYNVINKSAYVLIYQQQQQQIPQ